MLREKYNIWNKWDPLKVCMLGNNYAPEFFNGLPDKAGDPLKRICEETLEDLAGFKKILQDFGVEVIQPEMDPNERFIDNPSRYPRGPLQPRDRQIVLANKCYISGNDHPSIKTCLENYGEVTDIRDVDIHVPYYMTRERYDFIRGDDYPSYEDFLEHRKNKDFFKDFVWEELLEVKIDLSLDSASSFPLGDNFTIGIGFEKNIFFSHIIQEMKYYYTVLDHFHCKLVPVIGHSDSNFHPIKPGAILSLHDVQNYEKNFPGWDVCYLPEQGWSKVESFLKLKRLNKGKWWVAGEEDNDEFTHFVETWLQDWVGYVEETVFDVNVLMLDENHCCVSNPNNEQVNAFFKKHKIEPVHVPWRHRWFWDGGLHCITLELYREGKQQNYFKGVC